MPYKDITLRLPEEMVEELEAEVELERANGNENATSSTVVGEALTAWLVL